MSTKGYKCPCCGGNLEFSSDTQKLQCPSCGNQMEMGTYEQYAEAVETTDNQEDIYEWEEPGQAEAESVNEEGKKIYICPSCGGELDAEATTAATRCPYCDSPVILSGQISGRFRPDLLIPFQLDRDAAKETYKKFCKGKRLLPRAFQSDQRIQEIEGVYVPFWLFSCQAEGTVNYDAQKVKKWKDTYYEYTQKDYYLVSREGRVSFEHVPVDGSVELDDAYMESIEPFKMEKAVPFDEAYLSGYEAMKYDVDVEESRGRAEERIKITFEEILKKSVDKKQYQTISKKNSSIVCRKGKVQYALLPVWLVKVKYKDHIYQFAMNGQTGKLTGELPIDKGRFWKYALGIFAASSLAAYLVMVIGLLM